MRFSRRSSIQATDVLSLRASQQTTTYSAGNAIFCPKPPPTSGAITRRSASGIPISWAMIGRTACGICVEQVSATLRLVVSQAAWAPRGSSGHAVRRWQRGANLHPTVAGPARLERQRVLPMRAGVELDPPLRGRHDGIEARRLHAAFDHDVSGRFA